MLPTRTRGEVNDANESIKYVEDDNSSTYGGTDTPTRPMHDVSYVHDFPARSTRPGLTPNGRVRGGAMLVLDDDAHSPIAFSAGLPGGVQLSQLPDPRCVREAMAAPDAEGWRDTPWTGKCKTSSRTTSTDWCRTRAACGPSDSVGYSILGVSLHGPMLANADNQASIALGKNPVFHDCSKHVDIKSPHARPRQSRRRSSSTTSRWIC